MNQIMVVAVFHMKNKNDLHNFQQTDLIASREQEIIELTDALGKFQPTRIAVEVEKTAQAALSQAYEAYLTGKPTEIHEVSQLAFRLAKNLGLSQIDAVNWMETTNVGCGDVINHAMQYQPDLLAELEKLIPDMPNLEQESVLSAVRRLNNAQITEDIMAHYMNYARIGAENYYGNQWLLWWYQRNMNIFTNLTALLEHHDNERLMLLIGASHKGIIEQFIQNSRAYQLVDVNDYLQA